MNELIVRVIANPCVRTVLAELFEQQLDVGSAAGFAGCRYVYCSLIARKKAVLRSSASSPFYLIPVGPVSGPLRYHDRKPQLLSNDVEWDYVVHQDPVSHVLGDILGDDAKLAYAEV